MIVRPLRAFDLEPLHRLYLSFMRMTPHSSRLSMGVSLEQFAAELTTTRHREDEHWDADAEQVLVAVRASGGDPIAFAHVSFLQADARHSDLKAGAGMIRFAFAAPEGADVLRLLLRAAPDAALARRDCSELRAFAGYAPLFHQFGESAVSNAWPWVGRAMTQEGFRTMGAPVLAMRCRLTERLPRLPLPDGAELRYDWVTRVGERDATEGGFHLFIGDDRAAESMWHFGEKYVRGAGNSHVHLFWLGTNPPYRGRGLGRILLRETLVRAQEQGATESSLHCNPDNFFAHALYRAEGYQPDDLLWAFRKPLV